MKKILIATLLFLISLHLFSQKKYPSLFWEISGNGLKEKSYLYGTMHVSEKIAFLLSDAFYDKLRSVNQIALESNPELWMDSYISDMERFSGNDYASLNPYYSSVNYKSFYLSPIEVKNVAGAMRMGSYITDAVLYRNSDNNKNFQENTFLDMFIYRAAKKNNKKFFGLEDLEESRKLVEKAKKYKYQNFYNNGNPKPWLKKLLKDKTLYSALEEAYRNKDLDMIDSLQKGSSSEEELKYLLYLRNDNMVKAMDSLMKKSSLFSAVGAAHLPGKQGIIEKLRAKGYKVTPIFGKLTEKGKKAKEDLDNKISDKKYILQSNLDGFQVKTPDKFSSFEVDKTSNYSVSLDIANGAFLSLARFKKYDFLRNDNYSVQLTSIDSLLYENIPGKIISQLEVNKNNGIKGFDIESKTESGNYRNFQIFLTPLEVYVFNLSGEKKYAQKFKNEISNSLSFKTGTGKFINYSPIQGGYSVDIPDYYISSEDAENKKTIKMPNITAYDFLSDSYYFVNTNLYDEVSQENEDFELERIPFEFCRDLKIDSVQTTIKTADYKYSETQANLKNGKKLYLKTVINGAHYNLLGISTQSEKEKEKFFHSFTLSKFNRYKTKNSYKNNENGFEVQIPFLPSEKEKIFEESLAVDSVAVGVDSLNVGPKNSLSFDQDSHKTFVLDNGQKVEVNAMDLYGFDVDELKDVEKVKKEIADYYEEDSCTFNREFLNEGKTKNNYTYYDFITRDSISAQVVKLRYFFENNKIYEIKSIINKHKETPNDALNDFYENIVFFTASPEGEDFLQAKDSARVAIPSGTITAEDEKEIEPQNYVFAPDSGIDNFEYNAIEDDKALFVSQNSKNQEILDNLKTIKSNPKEIEIFLENKSEEIDDQAFDVGMQLLDYHKITDVNYYENLFHKYENKGDIQFKILNKIAEFDSKNGASKTVKLINQSIPIPSSSYEVSAYINNFKETENKTTKKLSKLGKNLDIEEYKMPLVDFYLNLLEKDKLKPQYIKKYKNTLFKMAQLELKRNLTTNNYNSLDYAYAAESQYTTTEFLKNLLDILSVFNEKPEYKKLISDIKKSKKVELLSLLTELKTPQKLSEKEYALIAQKEIPTQKVNEIYKKEFGKNIISDVTYQLAEKQLTKELNWRFDSASDSLSFYKKRTLKKEGKEFEIFYFKNLKKKAYLNNFQNSETKPQPQDSSNMAVIVFDLNPTKEQNNSQCLSNSQEQEQEDFSGEDLSYGAYNTLEDPAIFETVYVTADQFVFDDDDWIEFNKNLDDYILNQEHSRASFNLNDGQEIY